MARTQRHRIGTAVTLGGVDPAQLTAAANAAVANNTDLDVLREPGAEGEVLTVVGGVPDWAPPTGGAAGSAKAVVSPSAPVNPDTGLLWLDTDAVPSGVVGLPEFDPRDFGAVMDGVTNDRAAFAATIAAAEAAGGGVIVIPGLIYLDTAAGGVFSLASSHIHVLGYGHGASHIKTSGPFLSAPTGYGAQSVSVKNLSLNCTTATNTYSGITKDVAVNWAVEDCLIYGYGGDSVRFSGAVQCFTLRNRISARDATNTNGHAGLYITDRDSDSAESTTVLSHGNYVYEGKQYGILWEKTHDSVSIMDIVEYCDVGMRFVTSRSTAIRPYTEGITGNAIEVHNDATAQAVMRVQNPRLDPGDSVVATWVSNPYASRYDHHDGPDKLNVATYSGNAIYPKLDVDVVLWSWSGAGYRECGLFSDPLWAGKVFTIKRVSSTENMTVVTTVGGSTIDGSASKSLNSNGAFITVVHDGTNWHVIASGGTVV